MLRSQQVDLGSPYENPFVGPITHKFHVHLDVSALSNQIVDEKGYIPAGALLRRDGMEPDGTVGEEAFPVTETLRVANGNTQADLDAAVDGTIAVAKVAVLNMTILTENLGRALRANEIAAVKETKTIEPMAIPA